MSFRLFVYYCALGGAWCGFVGWLLGRLLAPSVPVDNADFFPPVLRDTIIALLLGFAIALGLSFLDATFNFSLNRLGKVMLCVAAAVVVGMFGGMCGGFVGSSLITVVQRSNMPTVIAHLCFVLGWTIVGFLIGMSICFFEVLAGLFTGKDFGSALKKLIKCFIGGTIGGILGGCIAAVILAIARAITGTSGEHLRSPSAIGFVALGACIGLLVGLAQIILKEAWIKVEAGFRPGREMLLQKEKTSIGRAEGSDIALFGDMGVEKTHAHIIKDGGRYYLEDSQTPSGSFVNDQKVVGRAPLKAGDLIRVGKSLLRFNERAKRKD